MQADLVLVVDYGAQYAQLIARRVREAKVYSEIVPHTMPVAEMLARNPKAIVLSGGPSSVYDEGAPTIDSHIFTSGTPVFGMCYGFQLMVAGLGGVVERVWSLRHPDGKAQPPMTRFLAEQLSTAHWFDQRRTREALAWTPAVSIAEGLDRLAAHYRR